MSFPDVWTLPTISKDLLLLFIFWFCPAFWRPAVLSELITTSPTHAVVNLCSNWRCWTAFVLLLQYTYRSIPHTHYSSPLLSIRHYWGPHTCGIFVTWSSTDRTWMPWCGLLRTNLTTVATPSTAYTGDGSVSVHCQCTCSCWTVYVKVWAGRREALVWSAIDLDTYRHTAIDLDRWRHTAIDLDRCRQRTMRKDGRR